MKDFALTYQDYLWGKGPEERGISEREWNRLSEAEKYERLTDGFMIHSSDPRWNELAAAVGETDRSRNIMIGRKDKWNSDWMVDPNRRVDTENGYSFSTSGNESARNQADNDFGVVQHGWALPLGAAAIGAMGAAGAGASAANPAAAAAAAETGGLAGLGAAGPGAGVGAGLGASSAGVVPMGSISVTAPSLAGASGGLAGLGAAGVGAAAASSGLGRAGSQPTGQSSSDGGPGDPLTSRTPGDGTSGLGGWARNNAGNLARLGLAGLGAMSNSNNPGGPGGGPGSGDSTDANSIIEQMAAANRVNHNTPLGSRNWSKDPVTGQWTVNDTMNPAEQANFGEVQGMNADVTGMARQRLAALLANPSQRRRADEPLSVRFGG